LRAVANVTLNEIEAPLSFQIGKAFEIPCVREAVQNANWLANMFQPEKHKVASDKASSASYENHSAILSRLTKVEILITNATPPLIGQETSNAKLTYLAKFGPCRAC
jgi:hypothetical protein